MTAESEPQTSIIRRHPTGEFPAVAEPQTSYIGRPAAEDPQTSYIPRARPVAVGAPRTARANPRAAIATAVASIRQRLGHRGHRHRPDHRLVAV